MGRLIALDIETSGELFGEGSRILCCGAYGDGISRVFDFDSPRDIEELRDLLADPSADQVFHNCMFDATWLYIKYGMDIKGVIHDTMTRASLIDEYAPLALDECCRRSGIPGKNKSQTIEAWFLDWQKKIKGCAKGFRKGKVRDGSIVMNLEDKQEYELSAGDIDAIVTGRYKKNVWANALPLWSENASFKDSMMTYNLQDCRATYMLFKAQEQKMGGLQKVYDLECRLIPILLSMKKTGIRFDMDAALRLTERVEEARAGAERRLSEMYGVTAEMVASPLKLGERLNRMGIHSPVLTPSGKESWAEGALVRIHHPVMPLIQEFKNYDSILHKYLKGSLISSVIDGRIHCTFLPMLREVGGTVTGRFSCRDPNLQQIPARNKGHGTDFSQDMRALFLPEEGQMLAADDYSQIEALLLAHFAKGSQAEWFREQMRQGADLHKIVMGMTGITYRPVVKTFNYGCIYGMGWATAMEKNYTLFEKLAAEEGKDVESFTKEIYALYHNKFPVVRDTMKWCQEVAKLQGYIDTMGGRRLHKPRAQWDPVTCKVNDFIYKMLNKLIQGTAADILKQALVTAWDEGIYNVLTLHLLVHDEQVNSVPFNREGTEAAVRLQEIMGETYKDQLLVPIKAECELGPNWGYWSGDIYEEMKKGNFDPSFFNKDYRETH